MMTKDKMSRHQVLRLAGTGTLVLVGLFLFGLEVSGQAEVLEIRMLRNYRIGRYYFDPIALHVEPGQTVRWIAVREGFSVTAFHPDNDNHELRIPEKAKPFDSGILRQRETFEWTFEVEGTYDFFSRGHEGIGMIGRIVVGSPSGPGEKPLGYDGRNGRAPIFNEAIRTFEFVKSAEVVHRKVVPYPVKELGRSFPMY